MNDLKQPTDEVIHEEERTDQAIGRAFLISLGAIVAVACLAVAAYLAVVYLQPADLKISDNKTVTAAQRDLQEIKIPQVHFEDVTTAAGINFRHVNGASRQTELPKKLLPETMGGGVAFFDYDNDGDPDLFLVNSNYWPGEEPPGEPQPRMALYANDGQGHFTDVTVQAGLDKSFYGMGVAAGDFDNDGWRDLYISAVGKNYLFQNQQGVFVDVTEASGTSGSEADWGTSCGWFDYDRDGLLDLFVCNYITWSKDEDLKLGSTLDGTNRAYAPPRSFEGAFPLLFHNEGDGKFKDVSQPAGFQIREPNQGIPEAKSLGLSFFDFDHDGWTDIFVANDTSRNMLFRNRHDGTFEERGQDLGIAYDRSGSARGAMGIDVGMFRSDDSLGIVIGNFANEPVSLFVAQAKSDLFTDEAISSGLGPQTRQELTFGMFFFDYDLDGRLDIFTANGHLEEEIRSVQPGQRYEQPPLLFWNAGEESKTEFVAVPESIVGKSFCEPIVGRGAAYADIDADGDLDVVVTACGQKARLFRNDQQLGHHWLRVQLKAKDKNRDAIGAMVTLSAGGRKQTRCLSPTSSYLSQRELPLTFGLGDATKVDELKITWPDGSVQTVGTIEIDQLSVIEQQ
jgi:hypothetical protein